MRQWSEHPQEVAHPQLARAYYHVFFRRYAAHLLRLCPADVSAAARHIGEQWFFNGDFPAAEVSGLGYPHVPVDSYGNQLPGEVDVTLSFFYPSIGTLAHPDGALYAENYTRELHSYWRANLYEPGANAFNFDGRLERIEIISADSGDRDRFGNVRRGDNDTQNILWQERLIVRAYL